MVNADSIIAEMTVEGKRIDSTLICVIWLKESALDVGVIQDEQTYVLTLKGERGMVT